MRLPQLDRGSALLYFWLLLSAGLTASVHELVVRQADAFLSPGLSAHPHTLAWSWLAGVSLALLSARWLSRRPVELLTGATLAVAFVITCSGPLFFYGSVQGAVTRSAALCMPFGLGYFGSLAVAAALKVLGSTTRSLGVFRRLLDPFKLALLIAAVGFGASGAAAIGNQRSGYVLGMLLSALALGAHPLYRQLFLDLRRSSTLQRWLNHGARFGFVLSAAGLLLAEHQLPIKRLKHFPGELVFAAHDPRQELVITSSQDGFLLFADGQLRRTQVDGYRYVEAFVQPAMLSTPGATQVAMLGTGDGLAEREALKFANLEHLLVVVEDRAIVDLSVSSQWLSKASQGALTDKRVSVEVSELGSWIATETDAYDVILADLPAPSRYEYGKLYTRYIFERLAELLTDDGTLVLSATSAFSAPETYASIVSTLRAAGLNLLEYHVGVPLIGEASFILAGKRELKLPSDLTAQQLAPVGARTANKFLNPATLEQLFVPTPDTRPSAAAPNLLYDQPIVDHFRHETGLDRDTEVLDAPP